MPCLLGIDWWMCMYRVYFVTSCRFHAYICRPAAASPAVIGPEYGQQEEERSCQRCTPVPSRGRSQLGHRQAWCQRGST